MSYDDPDGECMPDPLDVVTYTYSYVDGLVTLPYSYTSCPGAVCEHDGDQGVFRSGWGWAERCCPYWRLGDLTWRDLR